MTRLRTASPGHTAGRSLLILVIAAALTASGTAQTTASRASLSAHAAAADQYLAFVALENADSVAILRGRPWRLASKLHVPPGPHNFAASPDGRFVAFSSPPADSVTIIDARRARVRTRVRITGRPHDVDFSGDGRFLWVTAEHASRLVLVSVANGTHRSLADRKRAAARPRVDRRRGQLWVTINGSSAVEVRSAATGRLLHRPRLAGAPHNVGFAGYRSVWFSNWSSGSLTVVDAARRRVRVRVPVGGEPHHFAAGAGALW